MTMAVANAITTNDEPTKNAVGIPVAGSNSGAICGSYQFRHRANKNNKLLQ